MPSRTHPLVAGALLDFRVLRALFVAFALAALATPAVADSEPVGRLLGPVQVVRVIDGDTVVLRSDLGPRSVRLIGIDAPEAHLPDRAPEPFWEEATALAQRLLPVRADVWIELDLELEDAYGRLVGYVYVEAAEGDWIVAGARARMVNLAIAEAGYARTLPIAPNLAYADLFRDAVRSARGAGLGMWGTTAP